jgi:hypothetical protein
VRRRGEGRGAEERRGEKGADPIRRVVEREKIRLEGEGERR